MVGCNFGGDLDRFRLGPADEFDGFDSRNMRDVQTAVGDASELDVAGDHHRFGAVGNPAQSEMRSDYSFIHVPFRD